MSPKEYKKKYGFTMKTPLSAKSVTKARSKAAKKRGLPENLKKYDRGEKAGESQSAQFLKRQLWRKVNLG